MVLYYFRKHSKAMKLETFALKQCRYFDKTEHFWNGIPFLHFSTSTPPVSKVRFSLLWRSEKCCARSRLGVFKFLKTKEPNSWYFRYKFYWNNRPDKIYGYIFCAFVLMNLKTTKQERAQHFSECQT